MKTPKPTRKSPEAIERRRESRLRRRAPLDFSSGKALQYEEDDSFEEAFELDADDLAFADTERGEALRTFRS
jgi:hypothetical protein